MNDIKHIEYRCGTRTEGLITIAVTTALLPLFIYLGFLLWHKSKPAVIILTAAWLYSTGRGIWMQRFNTRQKAYELYTGTVSDMLYRRGMWLFLAYGTVKYILLAIAGLLVIECAAHSGFITTASPEKILITVIITLFACMAKAVQDGMKYYNYYSGHITVSVEQPGTCPLTYRLLAKLIRR